MAEVLTVELDLRWADTDQYGHVNNVSLVRFVEEARIRAIGLPDQPSGFGDPPPVLAVLEPGTFTIVAGQRFEYRQELGYHGQRVLAELWFSQIGSRSLTLACRLLDVSRSTEYLVATVTVVIMDAASRRPRALTDAETAHLNRYLGPAVDFR
jgi:acyl-CoA thioester hydrolase